MEVYVARQPIFDRMKRIYGYELLFRGGMSNFFSGIDGDTATSKVLSNSFLSIGMDNITGSKLAFVNFTQDLLLSGVPLMFPKEKVVVEILENVEPEDDVIDICRHIAGRGYCIALDDFFYRSSMDPLIAMANIIKFDFRLTAMEEIEEYITKLSDCNVKFLAEKVETHEEFKRAMQMGCDYFQGYFFSKPEVIKGKDFSGNQMNLLQIMAEVNKEDFKFNEVSKIITRDVSISYKLLRYINSAYFGVYHDISSIDQALAMLGEKGIRRFLSLIAMSELSCEKPNELMKTSIIRARFSEVIGESSGSHINSSELFTLGLFSLIDAILDDSMENLMSRLPLSENIKKALVYDEGELKDYLRLAVCYEMGDWNGVSDMAKVLGFNEEKLPDHFMEALTWADAMTSLE
ncbi:MAG: HDOD domain-containing protein [Thermodesulfobacteriota bacterium]|nr:HDOD domain-containing protein [Thermodesulfobacteriota bacterium]